MCRKPRYLDVQKQLAIEHYLNHGCYLAFTSRTLGYFCSDVLACWINELYPDRRPVFTYKINPDVSLEPEVKLQAVMKLCTYRIIAGDTQSWNVSLTTWADIIKQSEKLSAPLILDIDVSIGLNMAMETMVWRFNSWSNWPDANQWSVQMLFCILIFVKYGTNCADYVVYSLNNPSRC